MRRAPGLNVEATIRAPNAANPLEGLAQALGVATNIATDRSAEIVNERIQDEEELRDAQAQADTLGGTIDENLFRESRTYARRVRIVQGQTLSFKLREHLADAAENYRRDNPLMSDQEMDEYLASTRDAFLENNAELMQDPRTAAIVQESMQETLFQIGQQDRTKWLDNVKTTGRAEASAGLVYSTRQTQQLTSGDLLSAYNQMRVTGSTAEEANEDITNTVVGLAHEFDNPALIRLLPEAWADGSVGPTADSNKLAWLDGQFETLTRQAEARRIENLSQERVNFRLNIWEKVKVGERPSEEDNAMALSLGFEDGTIASWSIAADNELERIQRKAQEALEDAQEHANMMELLESDRRFEVSDADAKEAYGIEYNNAQTPEARLQVVARAVRRGVLPPPFKDRLDAFPSNLADFAQWRNDIGFIQNLNPVVYAQVDANSRIKYDAYKALVSTGNYSEARAFERLQVSRPELGEEMLRSEDARELVQDLIGANGTGNGLEAVRSIIRGFGSLEDIPRDQVLRMAEDSFNSTYFVADGQTYNRAFMPDERRLEWAKEYLSEDIRNTMGRYIDPDDLIIAPVGGSGQQFTVSERGGLPITRIDADLIEGAWRQNVVDTISRGPREPRANIEARAAVREGLNPWRRIKGESGWARQMRAGRENEARRRAGQTVYPTPTSWDNAHR